VLFRRGRLSVGSKQGDVTRYSVNLSVQGRFLLHVLPAGFVKIRHFGLLANRNRRQALALCRLRLCAPLLHPSSLLTEEQKSALSRSCPQCKCGTLHVVARFSAVKPPSPNLALHCAAFDSS
jgi:hypothetical protein